MGVSTTTTLFGGGSRATSLLTRQKLWSRGTQPEIALFQALKRRRIYFAPHVDSLIGKPDIVFRKRVAVFVDSDFWHGHPDRYPPPKSNMEYWSAKVARNRRRDAQVNASLEAKGWNVIRLWEYDIKRDFDSCVERVLRAIGRSPEYYEDAA